MVGHGLSGRVGIAAEDRVEELSVFGYDIAAFAATGSTGQVGALACLAEQRRDRVKDESQELIAAGEGYGAMKSDVGLESIARSVRGDENCVSLVHFGRTLHVESRGGEASSLDLDAAAEFHHGVWREMSAIPSIAEEVFEVYSRRNRDGRFLALRTVDYPSAGELREGLAHN